MKSEKGITLVALVVTIIVLLILAGVALGLTLSDNGIINRSKNAVNTHYEGQEAENQAFTDFETEINAAWPSTTTTPSETPSADPTR